jgi:2'-5' RNA ligase
MATIQISQNTQKKLIEVAARLQIKHKKRISFDEAIKYLIKQHGGKGRNKERFLSFYGCLKEEKVEEARKELRALRAEEERRLEKLSA